GRIPGVKYLFKQKERSSIKSELVILLKPMVVEDADQTAAIGESMDRVRALRELLDKSYGG
ncbi:MAG: pilus (MSHA type) biogenesis protein MshL, partial [Gammaproteobacteria bacterium]|nr:pilus (MSHA type) biogenesis protein MshL [Gammaproteobacteria bacterium]